MEERRKHRREIRIPIPGTPAVLIEYSDHPDTAVQPEELEHKWQNQLDVDLADTFPASDPPSSVQPDPTRCESDPNCHAHMSDPDNKSAEDDTSQAA
ncbi:MAG: hypothetical protein JWO13_3669 [Acidobacteriales bacterium]|nr:hypothetical protein [Terriglobales bacterium]